MDRIREWQRFAHHSFPLSSIPFFFLFRLVMMPTKDGVAPWRYELITIFHISCTSLKTTHLSFSAQPLSIIFLGILAWSISYDRVSPGP